jgi:GNAT superfamily N-acetyltransferase
VGLASGTYVGSLNMAMIGYLVLASDFRGRGIGPRLRARLRERFERDARAHRNEPLAALVGEVETANRWLKLLVHRSGAIALDLPYYQPSLRPGGTVHPLILYYQPLGARRRTLPVAAVRRLLYAIWRRLYRIPKPLRHPAFRKMMRSLRGRARIGGRALD